jgi:hypothetical protein
VYHDLEIDDDMQLTVREFIACDKNCENFENVTDEMIMTTVAPSTESDTDETESEDVDDGDEEPVPTASEARSGFCLSTSVEWNKNLVKNMRQSNIIDFFRI